VIEFRRVGSFFNSVTVCDLDGINSYYTAQGIG